MKTIGSKSQVYKGNAKHTSGGLKKKDIGRDYVGISDATGGKLYRYYSLSKSRLGKKNPWIRSLMKAKKTLGYPKHSIVFASNKRGASADQKELYKLAKEYHEKLKK